MPDALRVGHDAAFAAFTQCFLAYVADPTSVPARDRSNLLGSLVSPVMWMALLVFGVTYFVAEFGLPLRATCAHSRIA
jgi:hypothetical protein